MLFLLFSSRQVSAALAGYLAAVEETEATVRLELQALSDLLVANNDLPVIAQVLTAVGRPSTSTCFDDDTKLQRCLWLFFF